MGCELSIEIGTDPGPNPDAVRIDADMDKLCDRYRLNALDTHVPRVRDAAPGRVSAFYYLLSQGVGRGPARRRTGADAPP